MQQIDVDIGGAAVEQSGFCVVPPQQRQPIMRFGG